LGEKLKLSISWAENKMTNSIELQAEIRTTEGTSHARRMRRNEQVPAVIYGAGKDAQSLTMSHKDIFHALEDEATFSNILTLIVDGKSEQVIIKALQRHPYKPKITHIDFLRIKAKEKLVMQVPLHFIGEEQSIGLKEGGILSKIMNEVEIRCLPANLPEYLELDISALDISSTLHLSDIALPKGVEFSHELDDEHNAGVVTIQKAKQEETNEAEADTGKDEKTEEKSEE
jgi:large subunit ribosomal protein L25